MKQINHYADWIGAYLEWSGIGSGFVPHAANAAASTDVPDGGFAEAYLAWQSASAPAETAPRGQSGGPPRGRRAGDAVSATHGLREALLLAAVHAQADCLHILRQELEGGSAKIGTFRLAAEALEHAQRLLEDERLAWRALVDLHGCGHRRASDLRRLQLEDEWPQAIEHVAADMRSLSNTVLAMQFH